MIWVQRFRQGLRALAVIFFAPTIDDTAAQDWLTPIQLADFRRLQPAERLHSLRVLEAVRTPKGDLPHALAVAALMHDVGKSRYPITLFDKTLVVLVNAAAPKLVDRLSAGDPRSRLARPFVVLRHHPQWSGEILTAGDASPDAIWLAAHHADPPEQWHDHPLYPLLVRLVQADDKN